jgi:hypothetical protein
MHCECLWTDGPGYEQILAQVQVLAGDRNSAVESLQSLFKASGFNDYNLTLPLTPSVLRLHPAWDSLRNDPRVQSLQISDSKGVGVTK